VIFPSDPSIFLLNGRPIPGTVTKVSNAKRTWTLEFKKGTASSMGTSVFKGANLCEGFSVTTECVTEEEIAEVTDWRAYVTPANVKAKVTTFAIDNWIINWQKIDRGCITEIECPDPTDTGSCVFVFTFGEYNPPAPAATGKADPAKGALKGGATGGKPVDTELAKLQAQAAALGKQATAVTT
jgi:hypothetical protein